MNMTSIAGFSSKSLKATFLLETASVRAKSGAVVPSGSMVEVTAMGKV
jgi:hypothetical protein